MNNVRRTQSKKRQRKETEGNKSGMSNSALSFRDLLTKIKQLPIKQTHAVG